MSVYLWGDGQFGQLGANVTERSFSPTILNWRKADQVIGAAAGSCHTLFLVEDGSVYSMGDNSSGQLGLGDYETRSEPTRIDALASLAKVVSVSAGMFHSAVVLEDGNVALFGQGSCGQLGNGRTTDSPKPRILMSFKSRKRHVVQVACGGNHTLFLLKKGNVYALGANDRGQLGHGDTELRSEPSFVRALLGVPVIAVAAGDSHSVALSATGEVLTWGCDKYGQLGHDLKKTQLWPTLVANFPSSVHIVDIACGDSFTSATSADGRLWVWGQGSRGQTGHGGTGDVLKPRPVDWFPSQGWKVTSVSLGSSHCLATAHPQGHPEDPQVFSWGSGDLGVLGNGDPQDKFIPCQVSSPFWSESASLRAVSGGDHAVLLRAHAKLPAASITNRITVDEVVSQQLIRDIFSSPASVNTSLFGFTNWALTPFDPEKVEEFYVAALSNKDDPSFAVDVLQSMEKAIIIFQSLWQDQQEPQTAILPTSLRFLLIFLQSPVFAVVNVSHKVVKRLCSLLLSLNPACLSVISKWLRQYPTTVFGSRLVRMLLLHLHHDIDTGGTHTASRTLLAMLQLLANNAPADFPLREFYSSKLTERLTANREAVPILVLEYLATQQEARSAFASGFSAPKEENVVTNVISLAPAILSPRVKHEIFKFDALIRMSEKNMAPIMGVMLVPAVSFSVRRSHLLRDSMAFVGANIETLRNALLQVQFAGEEGQDEGGPKREFFQLLLAEIFNANYGMFSWYDDSRVFYPRGDANLCESQDFYYLGGLLGIAHQNDVLLELNLPPLFYSMLTRPWRDESVWGKVGIKDVAEIDPQLAHGLRQLRDYEGDIEDTFGRTFTVDVESLGTVTTIPLKPGGENIPVTRGNREEYIKLYCRWFLFDRCSEQLQRFHAGFWATAPSRFLGILRGEELETLLCGTSHMDMHDLEKTAIYEGYKKDDAVVEWFWEVLYAMTFSEQKKFLSFATGCSRAPVGGLSELKLKLQKSGDDPSRLPAAHTCFNLIHLPPYKDKEQVKAKLQQAITNTEGFGLL